MHIHVHICVYCLCTISPICDVYLHLGVQFLFVAFMIALIEQISQYFMVISLLPVDIDRSFAKAQCPRANSRPGAQGMATISIGFDSLKLV